jgi:HTH-type transcriptional regulator / antitoxin HigA
MDVRALHSEADYEWALKEVERYFEHQPAPRTPEADRFDVLATLIEAYERAHHPIPDADPIDVLQFAIEELGRSQVELAEMLGSRSRASEILKRRRPLTLDMIRKISAAWHIPLEALAQPYALSPPRAPRAA